MTDKPECPTCAGRDPYRETITITATEPGKARAVRMREAWRAFWRHRGEEISAAWAWVPETTRGNISFAFVMLAVIGSAAAVLGVGCRLADHDCSATCSAIECQGVSKDGTCYCIVDGKPTPWHKVGQ